MYTNFTPLDVALFYKNNELKNSSNKSIGVSMIFLSLVVVTLVVLSVILFILIQRKLQELAYISFIA